MLVYLREVQYKTAATEGSHVIGPDTFALAEGSCKLDYDRALRQPALGSGNTLVDPAEPGLARDAVQADLHIDKTKDQSRMVRHTRPVADKVHTVGV